MTKSRKSRLRREKTGKNDLVFIDAVLHYFVGHHGYTFKKSLDYSDSLSPYKTFIWIGLVATLSGTIAAVPVFILVLLLLMTAMHEIMAKKAVCKFQFAEKEG